MAAPIDELPGITVSVGIHGVRLPLPQRRMLETFEMRHGAHRYTVSLGRDPDDPSLAVREVFLTVGKDGAEIGTYAHDLAILTSLLLQHGCSVDTMRHAVLRNPDNSPAGPIGRVLDLIARQAL